MADREDFSINTKGRRCMRHLKKNIPDSLISSFAFRSLMRLFILTVSLYSLIIVSGTAHAGNLQICTDINYWYPYTYESNGKAKGIHVDIVSLALKNLGHDFTFTPLPWKRCLKEAQSGKYSAVVSGSYKTERAKKLLYPPDASHAKKSRWRITQVEYVVVSHIENAYDFKGDLKTVPGPVRAPLGYSIVEDLKKQGIDVITASSTYNNFRQLVNSKRGVVISPPQNALKLNNYPEFAGKLQIHSTPIKSKSYFLLFSKVYPGLYEHERQKIWDEIMNIRKNKDYMDNLLNSY